MSKKIQYTDEPMGEMKLIEDFLPPPEQLVLKNQQQNSILSIQQTGIVSKHEKIYSLGFTDEDIDSLFKLFEKELSSIEEVENNKIYKDTSNVIPLFAIPIKEKENVKRRQTS